MGDKLEGSYTCLTSLGIELDTVAGELRLPTKKLHHLEKMLREWHNRKACPRKELESLIGSLNHACKVIRPRRSLLRRIIDLLRLASGSDATCTPPHSSKPQVSIGHTLVENVCGGVEWHQCLEAQQSTDS